jgi:hypothetical protein
MSQIISRKSSEKGKHSKNEDIAEMGERSWKFVYVILCLLLLAFTAWQISGILTNQFVGWDYRTYVGGVQAFDHSKNPYILENIIPYQLAGANLLFDYPPHTLYFFWLLDFFSVFHYMGIYYILLVILLGISAYLIVKLDKKPHYLFLTTLLLTGFMGTFWNFNTGNSTIFFLLLFAIMFTLLVKGKYWESSIVMGLSAAVSLFTAPFIALYLVVRRPIRDRLALISLSIGVVASLFVVDYIVNSSFLLSYTSMMRSSAGPFSYPGGWNEPTPYLMFKDVLNGMFPGNFIPFVIVSCIYVGFILYATLKYYCKNNGDTMKIFSLVMLSIFMILPRIMPYDFIILVVPLYLLFKDGSYRIKSLALAVITLPLFTLMAGSILNHFTFHLTEPILPYVQTYSLILIFIVFIHYDYLTPISDEKKVCEKKSS